MTLLQCTTCAKHVAAVALENEDQLGARDSGAIAPTGGPLTMIAKTFSCPLEPVVGTVAATNLENEDQSLTGMWFAPLKA